MTLPGKVSDWPPNHQMGSEAISEAALSSSNMSASQIFTKWLKRRRTAVQPSADSSSDPSGNNNDTTAAIRGQLFPARLALALGMAKTLLGVLLVAFGSLALWEQASMAYLGSGLWTGAVVLLSGLLGVMAGQRRNNLVYIVSYLLMSVLSLAAIGLLLIFAATGLARDSDAPYGYFVDQEEGSRVEFLGTVPLRQRPVIINAVLVALGTLSTIFSLAAVVICLREACLCYRLDDGATNLGCRQHRRLVNSNSSSNSSHMRHHNKIQQQGRNGSMPNMNLLTADQSPEGQARAYRLLRWLRQSHPHQQQPQQVAGPPLAPAPLLQRLYNPGAPIHPVMHPMPVHPVPVAGPVYPSFMTGGPTAYVIPAQPVLMAAPAGYHHPQFYSLTSLPSLHSTHLQSLQHLGHHPPAEYVQHRHQQQKVDPRRDSGKSGRNKSSERERRRRSRSTDAALHRKPVVDETVGTKQPAATPTPRSHKQPHSDGESTISGYIFTGMDRDVAEEFVSMTHQPHSLTSSINRRRPSI